MSATLFSLRVGNAPCSWGTLEFQGHQGKPGEQIAFGRMLDELAETGYTGTELGDWGYMPTDPGRLVLPGFRPGAIRFGADKADGGCVLR